MKVRKLLYLIRHTDFSSFLFIFIPVVGMTPALPAAVSFSRPAHQDTVPQGAVYML